MFSFFRKRIPNYFQVRETTCNCGCGFDIKDAWRTKLNKLRHTLGFALTVTGPARCREKNKATPNSSPNSAHCLGVACDIGRLTQGQFRELIETAQRQGIRTGTYLKDGEIQFVHLDDLLGERQHFTIDLTPKKWKSAIGTT